MEAVLGIGGLFFRARDPAALSAWYQKHLGINPVPTQEGQSPWETQGGVTVFAPFPHDTGYFGDPRNDWMINFRVRDLEAMVRQLRAADIEVRIDPEAYPHGRFARLHDPENHPIELWEPGGD
jgi:glyoxylase I family protein